MTPLRVDVGVVLGLGVSASIALFVPLLLGVWASRSLKAPVVAWPIGAGTFFVSQVLLRLPWQIPLGLWLQKQHLGEAAQWGWIAFSSFTAGLFEETGRFLTYRFVLKERTAKSAVMMGLGHGGIESILLVGLSLVGTLVVYAALGSGHGLGMTAEQQQLAASQFESLTPLLALAGGVERLSSMTVHVGLSMLVFQCFVRGQRRWLWLAIGFHALSNFLGVASLKPLGAWGAEGVIGLFALLALWWTVRLYRRDEAVRAALRPH
jgi:uncharacterized membrane protein YhfC